MSMIDCMDCSKLKFDPVNCRMGQTPQAKTNGVSNTTVSLSAAVCSLYGTIQLCTVNSKNIYFQVSYPQADAVLAGVSQIGYANGYRDPAFKSAVSGEGGRGSVIAPGLFRTLQGRLGAPRRLQEAFGVVTSLVKERNWSCRALTVTPTVKIQSYDIKLM